MAKLYEDDHYLGDNYDTTVWTNGGTYHKVVVEDSVEGGVVETRRFFDKGRAHRFAQKTAETGHSVLKEKATRSK